MAAAGDQAFVGHRDNEFLAFDLKKQKLLWTYKDRLFPYESSAAVTTDRVLFGGGDKRLHCVRRDNGKVVWTFSTRGAVDSSPVVCGDKVLVGSNDSRAKQAQTKSLVRDSPRPISPTRKRGKCSCLLMPIHVRVAVLVVLRLG